MALFPALTSGALWLIAKTATATPLRLRADALAEARSPAGLLVLQGSDREHPYFDAETLVWTGLRSDAPGRFGWAPPRDHFVSDVLVLSLRVKEPHGWGEARAGRFVYATGAIRPVQIDGLSVLARAPSGTSVEAFGGVPVFPSSITLRSEWVAGGRVAQTLASSVSAGASFYERRTGQESIHEEVGADVAVMPARDFDLAAKGAYDLIGKNLADASASASARSGAVRIELFGVHRSPASLLPATSLFSVLGDYPSKTLGTTVRWQAAPRLDFLGTAAGQLVGGHAGGYGTLQIMLRTDDHDRGRVGLEARRQDTMLSRWKGLRVIGAQAVSPSWNLSSELEIAWADEPAEPGVAYPWGLLALAYRTGTGWEASLGVEAGATPRYRFESNALLRLSRALEVP